MSESIDPKLLAEVFAQINTTNELVDSGATPLLDERALLLYLVAAVKEQTAVLTKVTELLGSGVNSASDIDTVTGTQIDSNFDLSDLKSF